jgi:hypothetical protein
MMSLFQITASPDLSEYQKSEVLIHYPLLLVFLVTWVVFGAFGMVAMLTGVISESMFEKNQARHEEIRLEHEEKRQKVAKWCTEKFATLDQRNSLGEVATDDITPLIPQVEEFFKEIGLDYEEEDIATLVDYMDDDETGYISVSEFTHHVLSLAEQSGSASLHEVKHIMNHTKVKCEKSCDMLMRISQRLDGIEDRLSAKTQDASNIQDLLSSPDLCGKSASGAFDPPGVESQDRPCCSPRQDDAAEFNDADKVGAAVPPIKLLQAADNGMQEAVDSTQMTPDGFQMHGLSYPYELDPMRASSGVCGFDIQQASCEGGKPMLLSVIPSVDIAIVSLETLQRHLRELLGNKPSGGSSRRETSGSTDPYAVCSGNTHQSSQSHAETFQSELLRVMESVVEEGLAAASASISAERERILELTRKLRTDVATSHRAYHQKE